MTIVRKVDVASLKLRPAVASGQHFPTATLVLGATSYTLTDVAIAPARTLPSGAGIPNEQYRLVFVRLGRT